MELLPDAKRLCEQGLGVGVEAAARAADAAGLNPWPCKWWGCASNGMFPGKIAAGLGKGWWGRILVDSDSDKILRTACGEAVPNFGQFGFILLRRLSLVDEVEEVVERVGDDGCLLLSDSEEFGADDELEVWE